MINQLEYHPYIQRQNDGEPYIPWMQSQGIQVAAFKGLSQVVRWPDAPLAEPLKRIAKAHHTTDAVVMLRWFILQQIVAVTTSSNVERLKDYWSTFDVELTKDEIEQISKVGGTVFRRWYFPERYAQDDRS